MKVYLIKASAPGPFKEYKKAMGAPPQNIFSVAAATPEGVGVSMCDETINMKPKMNTKADVVALFFHTPDAPHAYKLADKFRAGGKTVVLGGLHPSFMPDEASAHADALLIGEAEGIWEQLLKDYEAGSLQKIYKRDKPVDLAEVNPYPTDIIPPSKYDHIWTVLVSRGCVHRCDYCTVPPFFNGKYRLRPIENIVAEIKAAPTNWFELHADNLTANRSYALKLFEALKPLNINWSGEATIKLADDEELLRAAAGSGCKWLLVGIETPSQAALKDSGKDFVSPDTIKEKIERFHAHGIHVTSSMIFGFDTHTHDIFEESESFCRHIGIDEVEAVLLIPFPGTPLYDRMDAENRLLTRDWSKYDGSHAVFQPAAMTPEELEEGADRFWNEIRKKKASASPAAGSQVSSKPEAASHSPKPRRGSGTGGPALTTGRTETRWKSIAALGVIGIGLYFDWYWIWGALLIIWGITDLRSRHTYLLDDIPRSESPVLYWIVVLMWLLMGVWALSTAPAMAGVSNSEKTGIHAGESQINSPERPSHAPGANNENLFALTGNESGPAKAGDKEVKKIRQGWRLVKNERFTFTFQAPADWVFSDRSNAESVTLHLKNTDNTADITAIAFDYQDKFSMDDLIAYMEQDLQSELPFIKNVSPTTPMSPLPVNAAKCQMVYRQYDGELEGEKVSVQVGYAVDQSYGYSIIGVFGTKDHKMEKIIRQALTSFSLSASR